jgi:hypothetical protein
VPGRGCMRSSGLLDRSIEGNSNHLSYVKSMSEHISIGDGIVITSINPDMFKVCGSVVSILVHSDVITVSEAKAC